jgi:hypothetical protein
MTMVKVKVVRPAMIGGEPRSVGDVVELSHPQALDAVSGGRVELVKAQEPSAEEPKVERAKKSKAE